MLGTVPGPCCLCRLAVTVLWALEVSLIRCFTVRGRSRLPRPDLTSDPVLGSLATGRTQDHLLPQGQTPPHGTLCPGQDHCGLEVAPGPSESRHACSGCPRACAHERLNGTSSAPVPSVGGRSPSPLLL